MNLIDLVELRPVLGDGAMGTMLQKHGLASGDCPELWNIDKPDVVGSIHRAYADAGCDFVETNTFGASRLKLARHGLEMKLDEIIERGIDIARSAVGDACMVAGSVGPTGVLLEPYGDFSEEQLSDSFRRTVQVMEECGVDFFLIETMTDLNEALLAVREAKGISRRPVVATMVFSKAREGYRSVMGTSPEEAASRLGQAGADIVGTNCCSGMGEAAEIMKEIIAATKLPTIAQPNAGLPVLKGDRVVYPEKPAAMAAGLEDLLGLGVSIIGGCCGTTPDHLRQMAQLMGKCEHPPGVV